MVDDDRQRLGKNERCDSVEGGYTIFLDEETIGTFMETGDFSSAQQLDHFKEIGAQIERRLEEGKGFSLLALSVTEKRISRDFTVLQIAHFLAKHGRGVLIVDTDFLEPGLSGLSENPEELGFLDLLLYGSSLKSVSRSIGIDGVSVIGPGSFPVSRTVPFAHKEFNKVRDFLNEKNDVVIYCSTLYAEDSRINPLSKQADGIVFCCRIDEMEEGELQRSLTDLGSDVSPVELVCYCAKRELAAAEHGAEAGEAGDAGAGEVDVTPETVEGAESAYLEKTEEIGPEEEKQAAKSNLPRIITIAVAAVIVVFITWWVFINRSIRQRESSSQLSELVDKKREAREASEKKPAGEPSTQEQAATGDKTRKDIAGEQGRIEKVAPDEGTAPVAGKEDVGAGEAARDAEDSTGRLPPEGRETQAEAAAPRHPDGGRFAVHVASFRDINRAGMEAEYLEKNGFDARVIEFDVDGAKWFRVFAGAYETREEASEVRLDLLDLKRIDYARVVELKNN